MSSEKKRPSFFRSASLSAWLKAAASVSPIIFFCCGNGGIVDNGNKPEEEGAPRKTGNTTSPGQPAPTPPMVPDASAMHPTAPCIQIGQGCVIIPSGFVAPVSTKDHLVYTRGDEGIDFKLVLATCNGTPLVTNSHGTAVTKCSEDHYSFETPNHTKIEMLTNLTKDDRDKILTSLFNGILDIRTNQ